MYKLLDTQKRSHSLKKLGVLLALAGSATTLHADNFSFKNTSLKDTKLVRSLQNALSINVLNPSGKIGLVDLFAIHPRHNAWVQVAGGSITAPHAVGGVAGGYRYLFTALNPVKDKFVGFYGSLNNVVDDWKSWNIGGELATGHTQTTLNFNGMNMSRPQEVSGRMTVYVWQRMYNNLFRANPFVLGSYKLNNQKGFYPTLQNVGDFSFGGKLEALRYFSAEVRGIWTKFNIMPNQWSGGLKINLVPSSVNATYAEDRSSQRPERHTPIYRKITGVKVADQASAQTKNADKLGNMGFEAKVVAPNPNPEE